MRIGEVADRTGVSVDTVRFYERRGLLPLSARRPSGYREFDAGVLDRIDLVRRLQTLGLTINEIGDTLRAHDAGNATCDSERWRLEAVRTRVDDQIAALTALRTRLGETLDACRDGACTFRDEPATA